MDTPLQAGRSTRGRRLTPGERVLGVDPGLHITGYAVIEATGRNPILKEAGIIRSAEAGGATDMARRLQALYAGIVEVLGQFQPAVMAVEQLYAHYKHPRTAILMAHARGVLLLSAAEKGVSVVSYNATRIKKTVTGNGRAPKDQVQRTVQREFGLAKVPDPPDVADALAVALCHFHAQMWPGGVER